MMRNLEYFKNGGFTKTHKAKGLLSLHKDHTPNLNTRMSIG